eukprot:TRINITY_DN44889_c0_g1_i1.p1 TRINITY_DN44889_c0_g1~~TRINITY_DN44889_c0_g1_i1.p1  ORF type:complete len:609 (-),score=93.69 TRINITY_DN44889_c0_g1_i1:241-2067(-)
MLSHASSFSKHLTKAHIIKYQFCRPYSSVPQINNNQSLLHKADPPTTKFPFQDLLYLLEKCKGKAQLNQIHAHMISTGLIHNPFVATKLVTFLCSHPPLCGTQIAFSIADQMDEPDVYTWNTVLRGCLHDGSSGKEVLSAYAHSRRKCLIVDSYTLLYAIKACGLMLAGFEGEELHAQIFKLGFESEVITQTALVQMYGLFQNLESAQRVFDETPQRDLILWNALLATYEQRNHPHKALSVAFAMMNGNVRPNGVSAVSILSACSALCALNQGKSVHGFVIKCLLGFDLFVYNALINMYAKCRCLINARGVFEGMPSRNVVTWTSIINGYSENNCPYEALTLFGEMESANVRPDEITLLGVVSMCSKLGCSKLGEWIDHYIKKNGYGEIIPVANALMDMHSKCGNIKKACQVFDGMVAKTLVSWTTLIQGLAMHGYGIAALVRFCQMQREGFRPDSIAFLSILWACSHAGLVDEGRQCFRSMVEEHSIAPWKEHYGCMADLLCRAGIVDEAFQFVKSMPMKPDAVTWRTLFGACKEQGNVDLARQVMNHLLVSEPGYSGNYILASNLYAVMGEWDNVKEVRDAMEAWGVIVRDPACSVVELSNNVNIQ